MKKLYILVFLICFSVSVYAQVNEAPFFSGSLGGHSGSGENIYRNRNATSIILSTGFGLPLYNKIFLYTKLSYILRANYSSLEYNNFADEGLSTYNELVEVNGSFSQLLFNGGLQYNVSLTNDLTLGINGGVTYALVNHKASLPNGSIVQRLDNEGVFGVFSGLSLEKYLEDSNVSIFGEAQYNYARKDVVYFRDKFSGMNFTIGGRFYLSGR
ncbi:MAG: hypothetical protein R6W90_01270 [Ignavibacteriaceae bacterium]